MRLSRFPGLLAILTALAASAAFAQNGGQDELWEITMSVQSDGMSMPAMTQKACTPKGKREERVPMEKNCRTLESKQSGNRSIFKVVLPIAAPGILAGAALVSLTVLKELPATLLLRPTGTETLALRLWMATEELAFSQAAPYALLLVILGGLPALALNTQARKALSEVGN